MSELLYKAISIRQPWASLIVLGYKKIENRSWYTKYRGPILIHASKGFDRDCEEFAEDILPVKDWARIFNRPKDEFQRGGIIGIANLVNVKLFEAEKHNPVKDPWFVGKYGFVLEGARPLPEMVPLNGRLNIFDVAGEDAEDIQNLIGKE
jgi:hypothetical protein